MAVSVYWPMCIACLCVCMCVRVVAKKTCDVLDLNKVNPCCDLSKVTLSKVNTPKNI